VSNAVRNLPQLTLENLHLLDGGKLKRQFKLAIGRVLENISEFPVRNGKPETREINIKVIVAPTIKKTKRPIEGPYGVQEVEVPEISGLVVKAVIKDKLPIFESGNVICKVELVNGRLRDATFNPENSSNPDQMSLLDDLDDALDGEDDSEE